MSLPYHIVVFFGVAIAALILGGLSIGYDGYNHGDAYSFVGYREVFLVEGVTSFADLNTYFIAMLYWSKVTSYLINGAFVLFFITLISIITYRQRFALTPIMLLFLNSLWITRMAEPSREFLLFIISFVLGLCLASRSYVLCICLLAMLILIRPVFTPIFLLWVITPFVSFSVISLLVLGIVAFVHFAHELEIFRYYHAKQVEFAGIVTADFANFFPYKFVMNIFGGINSFLKNDSVTGTLNFLFGYLWRMISISWLLLSAPKCLTAFFGTIVLVSAAYPFPHPRYVEPSIYFCLGFATIASNINPASIPNFALRFSSNSSLPNR